MRRFELVENPYPHLIVKDIIDLLSMQRLSFRIFQEGRAPAESAGISILGNRGGLRWSVKGHGPRYIAI
ncbi:MAG: hypothetical protein OES09_15045 [Gammaproteobacteria bacterium]|nr:hypothetical protein [Gammaproteobacteria bacterium]